MYVFPYSTVDILLLIARASLERAWPHLAVLGLVVAVAALARRVGHQIESV
jgi:hypothetical protein